MPEQNVIDILKKVQQIQIVANRRVNDLMAGQYKSVFRGQGIEFDEVREYQPGDDIRGIDWNVTARSSVPYIKRYREERELTVLLLADISASNIFGSGGESKLDLVVEAAALLMFSALKNNDKVGLLTFCDDVIDYFPPRKGKKPLMSGEILALGRDGQNAIGKESFSQFVYKRLRRVNFPTRRHDGDLFWRIQVKVERGQHLRKGGRIFLQHR